MYLTKLILSIFVVFIYFIIIGNLPRWNYNVFFYAFLFSFLGYEMWFSYGILHGDSAKTRGSPVSNLTNAIINSIGDALISVAMVDFCLRKYGNQAFQKWDWRVFTILFTLGNIQNFFVAAAILPKLKGEKLSLSPFTPIRVPNVILTQEAWIIYPFIFYYFLIHSNIITEV